MTFRTLRGTLLVAFGVGVLAGAGQLGLGYGLGILRFGRAFDGTAASHWPAHLAWVSWFAMTAALIGAAAAHRTLTRSTAADRAGPPPAADRPEPAATEPAVPDRAEPTDRADRAEPTDRAEPAAADRASSAPGPASIWVRGATATAAALGGAVVIPLSMVPARRALVPSVDPVLIAGIAATLGAVVGLFAAAAVLGPRPLRWNLAGLTGTGWLLALVSVVPSLGPTDPMPAIRLGVFDPAWLPTGPGQRLALVTMPALALIAGAVTGGLARWREHPVIIVATCGVAGPAMLGLAYLIAGPGSGADRYQAAPYWGALLAAATGLLGSVLAATLRWPARPTATAPDGAADGGTPTPADGGTAASGDGGTAADETAADADAPPSGDGDPPPADDASGKDAAGDEDTAGPTTAPARRPRSRKAAKAPATPPAKAPATPPATAPDAPPVTANAPDPARSAQPAPDARHPTTEDFWPSTSTRPAEPPGGGRATGDPAAGDRPVKSPSAKSPSARSRPVKSSPVKNPPGKDRSAGDPAAGDETTATVPRQRGRRGRARTEAETEVPAGDAEYVDWVSGLRGRNPQRDDAPRAGGPGRRPTGDRTADQ